VDVSLTTCRSAASGESGVHFYLDLARRRRLQRLVSQSGREWSLQAIEPSGASWLTNCPNFPAANDRFRKELIRVSRLLHPRNEGIEMVCEQMLQNTRRDGHPKILVGWAPHFLGETTTPLRFGFDEF